MDENLENDLQEVQPEEDEQTESDLEEYEVEDAPDERDEEIARLKEEAEAKDEQIANLERIKREQKKAAKKPDSKPKKAQKQSDELDYGEKAYLNTLDIKESEHDFVNEQRNESGLTLKELLANGYFQAKLKERRDAEVVKKATPSGTRGSKEPSNSKVDYWIDRGELPPNTPENRQLRTEVVNARIKYNESANNFTQESVIEG